MTAIMLRKTKFNGAIDVHNRVTLVNDIVTGKNKTLNRRIDCSAAMRWKTSKYGEL
jgi:hypothetical protein